jgi:hypothetical protein
VTDLASTTRRLTDVERIEAHKIVQTIQLLIEDLTHGDKAAAFAMRRYVYTRLMHNERGTPMFRRNLKRKKMISQNGLCAECNEVLPIRDSELDRFVAIDGYTEQNTRLIHHACHRKSQEKRNFA